MTGIAPAQVRLVQITDGTSHTMLLSEGMTARSGDPSFGGGPLGDVQTATMGGALFSAQDRPNSDAPDRVLGPCPADVGDSAYPAPCLTFARPLPGAGMSVGATAAVRSRHPLGVNVALADGSVRFVTNEVSGLLWRSMGTRGGGEQANEVTAPPAKRILFIGNSYTFGHALPELLAHLCQASKWPVEIESHTAGGATLEKHYNDGAAVAKIRSGRWDFVVLQEQSMRPIVQRGMMWRYARLFDAEIRKSGARTVFFLTWARAWWPESQADLTNAYQGIARELGADVVPVGIAWEDSLRLRPSLALHDGDGSHSSPVGNYLAACVFHGFFTGGRGEGLPAIAFQGPGAGHAPLPEAIAKYLQQLGGAVGRSWR